MDRDDPHEEVPEAVGRVLAARAVVPVVPVVGEGEEPEVVGRARSARVGPRPAAPLRGTRHRPTLWCVSTSTWPTMA